MLNGELLGGGVLTGQIGREVITISKEEQDVVIEPRREQFDVYPDVGKVIKKATVKAVTSDIDENIVARNIRGGVTILGVTGELEPDKPDQSKVVEPSRSEQVVTADSGFELASVTVKPVTAEIDSDIVAENIRKDTEILGVVGTLEAREDLDSELAEQESLLAELESGVGELPERPVDRLQWKCDNIKSLAYEFIIPDSKMSISTSKVLEVMNGVDTSNVVYMNYMFGCLFNPCYIYSDLSSIDINAKSCKTMTYMFSGQEGLKKPPNIYNTENVLNFSYMFNNCDYLEEAYPINTSGATNLRNMYSKCIKLKKAYDYDLTNADDIQSIYNGCSALEGDIKIVINQPEFNINSAFYNCIKINSIVIENSHHITNIGGAFYNCKLITDMELNLVNCTIYSTAFTGCTNLTNLNLKNIKVSITIGNRTSYGTLLTDESIINTFQELWDMTGSSAKTLTLSTPSNARTEAIYVKLVEVTDEMRAEDEYIDNKKPCVVCESTDEGAMTLKEYGISKGWQIA